MKLVATESLMGTALDWAVAKCEKLNVIEDPMGFKKDAPECSQAGFWVWDETPPCTMQLIGINGQYSPSTNWSQAGPIIEKYNIAIAPIPYWTSWVSGDHQHRGQTALISAMKAYVASVLGEEIEVPENILYE